MSEKYTKESVDMIYDNAKRLGYNEGFRAGYKRGVEDARKMVEKLTGGEE